MKNEAKMAVIDELMGRVVQIRRSLEVAVLDGTPYLLIAEINEREMFYCGNRKWRDLAILDGTVAGRS